MKEEHWDEPEDSAREFFDSVALLHHPVFDEQAEKRMRKLRVTELRRRAEERMDWKRIAGEYDFDMEADNVDDIVDD
ncbi:MAG: hypothetical protein WD772_01340 [Pseudohongiellaceae bacterium]